MYGYFTNVSQFISAVVYGTIENVRSESGI